MRTFVHGRHKPKTKAEMAKDLQQAVVNTGGELCPPTREAIVLPVASDKAPDPRVQSAGGDHLPPWNGMRTERDLD